MYDENYEAGHEVASESSKMISDYGLANGAESLAIAQAIAALMPGFFFADIVRFYQKREMRGKSGGEAGARNAYETLAAMAATSAFLLAELSAKHTMLAKELCEKYQQGAGSTELMEINQEAGSLDGATVDRARYYAVAYLRGKRDITDITRN